MLLTFDEYQDWTKSLAKYPKNLGVIYTALKLTGEAGEYSEKIGKIIRDNGGEITFEIRDDLILELGDVLWYISEAARMLGISLQEVVDKNVTKLESRKARGTIGGSGDHR